MLSLEFCVPVVLSCILSFTGVWGCECMCTWSCVCVPPIVYVLSLCVCICALAPSPRSQLWSPHCNCVATRNLFLQKLQKCESNKALGCARQSCKYIKGSFFSICYYSCMASTECHTWAMCLPLPGYMARVFHIWSYLPRRLFSFLLMWVIWQFGVVSNLPQTNSHILLWQGYFNSETDGDLLLSP